MKEIILQQRIGPASGNNDLFRVVQGDPRWGQTLLVVQLEHPSDAKTVRGHRRLPKLHIARERKCDVGLGRQSDRNSSWPWGVLDDGLRPRLLNHLAQRHQADADLVHKCRLRLLECFVLSLFFDCL